MMKKLLTTFAVLTVMTAFAMAQTEPILNSGTITNKGTIVVGCNDAGAGAESILNTTTGVITNDGTIQFTGDNPRFANANTPASVANNGTIQFDGAIDQAVMSGLGTGPAAALRLGGTVVYNASGTDNQIVQGEFYYTNLTLASAGTKSFTSGEDYYVSEVYTATGSGARTYAASIFHYDGTGQTIFAENGAFAGTTNYYFDLELDGSGAIAIATTETVHVSHGFNEIGGVTLSMGDVSNLIFNNGITATVTGTVTATGATIKMNGVGTFDVAGSGIITFNAGATPGTSLFEMNGGNVQNAGAMTFNDGSYEQKSGNSIHTGDLTLSGGDYNQITGNVALAGNTTISAAASTYKQDAGLVAIAGGMTVSAGLFDINGTDATDDLVTIDGGGALALTGGSIDMAASTNMLVDGAFTNSGGTTVLTFNPTSTVTYNDGTGIIETSGPHSFGNLVLQKSPKTPVANIYLAGNFSLSDADLAMGATNKLVMTNGDKSATIEDIFEVTGQMSRNMNPTVATAALTFNNSATTIAITTGTLDTMTLYVRAGDTGFGDFKTAEDIQRSIEFNYGTASSGMLATMTYGYKQSELPGGGADPNFSEALLRYREVLTPQVTTPPDPGTSQKVATGNDPGRLPAGATTWGKVSLAGIKPGTNSLTDLAIVGDDGRLFLRGTPTTYFTISDGRWSNPGTWDEGRQPGALDKTEILHTVHVGFAGGSDVASNPNGWIDEKTSLAGGNKLAQEILITDTEGASLIFGNPLAGAHNSTITNWELSTDGIITNQNTNVPTNTNLANLDATDLAAFVTSGNEKFQGLIIFGGEAVSLKTNQLVNAAGGNVMVGPATILQICD